MEKLIELSRVFNVTTDYLLKPSEVDELSIRTEMLENQQQSLLAETRRKIRKRYRIVSCTVIYLIAFAISVIFRFALFKFYDSMDLPGITGYLVIVTIATAIAIAVNMHYEWSENSLKNKCQ